MSRNTSEILRRLKEKKNRQRSHDEWTTETMATRGDLNTVSEPIF